MDSTSASSGARARRSALTRWHLLALAVVLAAGALTLHRLDAAEVCGANEAIEGVFVQQMVEHGVLLFPLENGSAPMYKPPLFHWSAAALDRIGGLRRVDAFNLRLPSALYAIAGVALTIAFAWTPLGPRGAVLAGMILAASYQYVGEGRVGRVDMTLAFFETLAMMSCLWVFSGTLPGMAPAEPAEKSAARTSADVAMRYLFALALGLGVLAKGPVAVILPLGAIGVFLLRERRLAELGYLFTPGSLFVAIVTSLGWYVACAMGRRYGFLDRQLESENFGRFFGALGFMAPWYYLKPILLNSAPLSLIVPFAAAAALRRPADSADADAREIRARFDARLFATFWLLTVIFFTVAAYKRRAYLLPLWPASAFLLAWGAGEMARRGRWGRVARAGLAALCAGLIAFNFVYLPRREAAGCAGGSLRAAAAGINRTVGSDEPLYLYGFGDDPAPLLFYLDRDAPRVEGKLGDAPPGYVLVPQGVWQEHASEALDLKPVLNVDAGGDKLLLLRRGGAIGMADRTSRMP